MVKEGKRMGGRQKRASHGHHLGEQQKEKVKERKEEETGKDAYLCIRERKQKKNGSTTGKEVHLRGLQKWQGRERSGKFSLKTKSGKRRLRNCRGGG